MVLTIAICFAVVGMAFGQVNIEKYRGKKGISGNINLQLNSAAGNADFFDGGAAANLTLNTDDYTVLLVGHGLLGFASGKRFDNQGLAHLRITWTEKGRFQPESFFQSDYSRPRKLVARLLLGGGIRTILFENEIRHLSVGNSVLWEQENYDLPSNAQHSDHTSIMRSSNYVNLRLKKGVELAISGYYQISLSDLNDARIIGQAEITNPIVGPLEQRTSLRLRRDTDPPDNVKTNDLHLGTSFGITF